MTATQKNTGTTVLPAVEMIRVERIDPSPLNRHCADGDQDIAELASSIAEVGLLSPISIRPAADERFEIICGERRWRAFRWLGKEEIPCIVKRIDEAQAHAERLIENAQRKDLTILEQGTGVAALLKRCHGEIKEVADRLGCSERWVRVRAKLPNLSDAWRAELADPNTSYGDIRDSISKLAIITALPQNTQDDILSRGYLRYHSGTVAEIEKTLERLFMNLDTKPWSWKWEKANISSAKRCDACLKRSDREQTLFADQESAESGKDAKKLCLDSDCWHQRLADWCKHLFGENPDAVLLWDGHLNSADGSRCKEHFGQKPIPDFTWDERALDAKPHGEFSIPAVGIFVGGARAGSLIDIWLRNETGDKEFDAEQKEKAESRQREHETRRRLQERIELQLADLIPENAFELKAKAALSDYEFVATLLNWASWFGMGTANYTDKEMDITNISPGSCPGIQFAWSELREEIVSLMVQSASNEELEQNDWFIVSTVCEILSIDIAALGKECEEKAISK